MTKSNTFVGKLNKREYAAYQAAIEGGKLYQARRAARLAEQIQYEYVCSYTGQPRPITVVAGTVAEAIKIAARAIPVGTPIVSVRNAGKAE